MDVQEISIDEIRPYWNNARDNEKTIEPLCKSIQEYGFNQPIVVDRDMVIIVGHARLRAARKLGLKTVPVVVTDLDSEKAKKYRIADNKIQERTEWIEDRLFKELAEIGDRAELLDMGFALSDIDKVLADSVPALQEAIQSVEMVESVPSTVLTAVVPQEAPESVPEMITEKEPTREEVEKKLKEREAELNGRFVKESYEQHKYDNLVSCPYCGKQFMVRGVRR